MAAHACGGTGPEAQHRISAPPSSPHRGRGASVDVRPRTDTSTVDKVLHVEGGRPLAAPDVSQVETSLGAALDSLQPPIDVQIINLGAPELSPHNLAVNVPEATGRLGWTQTTQ